MICRVSHRFSFQGSFNKSKRHFDQIMKIPLHLLLLAALLGTVGCASYEIRPSASSIQVQKSAASIPVTVGITHSEQKVSGGFPDLVTVIKKNLDESSLFQSVYYPVRPDDRLDGGLELRLSARFKTDGALFGKAFLTGFFMFLPAPLVVYSHEYQSECTLDLVKNGKTLKQYKADGNVTVKHKLFASPEKIEAEGTEASVKLLGARLVEELAKDRTFIETELKRTAAAGNSKAD